MLKKKPSEVSEVSLFGIKIFEFRTYKLVRVETREVEEEEEEFNTAIPPAENILRPQ